MLLLCLAAASVFSYTALHRTANLDEGFDRLTSLIRFAQAEAATTGRKVRLEFDPSGADSELDLRKIRVTWEADMLAAPGVFQDYTNKAWSEDLVNELVGIEKVAPIQSPNTDPLASPQPGQAAPDFGLTPDEEFFLQDFPAITFYPDGSCDSAELVLASRNVEDDRRLAVRLSGLLGSVTSRSVSKQDATLFQDDSQSLAEDPFQEAFEDSSSTGETSDLE